MIRGTIIVPLQRKSTSRSRGILDTQQQTAVLIHDLRIAATCINNLPEMIRGTIIVPLQRKSTSRSRGVLDAQQQTAVLIHDPVVRASIPVDSIILMIFIEGN